MGALALPVASIGPIIGILVVIILVIIVLRLVL